MFLKYDKKSQWFEDDYPGSTMNLNGSNCVLIVHTTEGTDWPGYNGGRTAPIPSGYGRRLDAPAHV